MFCCASVRLRRACVMCPAVRAPFRATLSSFFVVGLMLDAWVAASDLWKFATLVSTNWFAATRAACHGLAKQYAGMKIQAMKSRGA